MSDKVQFTFLGIASSETRRIINDLGVIARRAYHRPPETLRRQE